MLWSGWILQAVTICALSQGVASSTTATTTATVASSTSRSVRVRTTTTLPTVKRRPSTTTTTSTTTTSTSTTTTTSVGPVVTDEAYIDTVIRHHNVHRSNHSASGIAWSSSLAETAKQIASSCVYEGNRNLNGGGYGQNIAAGFHPTQMGPLITEGFYDLEVSSYTYYGGEPNYLTVGQWGHFTQIVWKSTLNVGCYTYDCTARGLQGAGPNVPPFFTVCNYAPLGNVVGSFASNVGTPLGNPSIYGGYACPTRNNCVN